VQLLNDQGQVIASTVTDRNGRYRFTLAETGGYKVRVLPLPRMTVENGTRDVFVSRGDDLIGGVDFAFQRVAASPRPSFRPGSLQTAQAASLTLIDAVFDAVGVATL
jgi:hypothetical protein